MLSICGRLRLRAKLLCGRLYTTRSVVGVVICRDDHYLLIEELRDGKLWLNIPAGHVDPRETPIEAAKREAKEESGLDVRLTGIRAILSNTWNQGTHSTYWVFDGISSGGGEVCPEPGCRAFWLTLEEWEVRRQTMNVMSAVPYIFASVKASRSLPTEAVYFIDRRGQAKREYL